MEKYQEKAKEYEVSFLEILEKKESTFSWKDLVPYSFSKQHILSPVDCNDQGWVVAVLDPLNVVSIDTLYYYLKKPIEVVCAPKDEILKAIEHIMTIFSQIGPTNKQHYAPCIIRAESSSTSFGR